MKTAGLIAYAELYRPDGVCRRVSVRRTNSRFYTVYVARSGGSLNFSDTPLQSFADAGAAILFARTNIRWYLNRGYVRAPNPIMLLALSAEDSEIIDLATECPDIPH